MIFSEPEKFKSSPLKLDTGIYGFPCNGIELRVFGKKQDDEPKGLYLNGQKIVCDSLHLTTCENGKLLVVMVRGENVQTQTESEHRPDKG